ASEATLHIKGGRATFDAAGLHLTPWFTRRRVRIPWANIEFVSTVRRPDNYELPKEQTLDGLTTPTAPRESLNFYCFEVALRDRTEILSSATFFIKWWLGTTVWLKPLYQADDTPHPSNGVITLDFRQRWLRKNSGSVRSALDLIERFSKFGLIFTLD